jgi:hypothetical protein
MLSWTYPTRVLLPNAFPDNDTKNAYWYFLIRLLRIEVLSPSSVMISRNACWHSLASLLELVCPSSNTKKCQLIGHNVYRGYPQAHGSIVVAFNLKVLSGNRYLYFSKERHHSKSSSMDIVGSPYQHIYTANISPKRRELYVSTHIYLCY